MWWGKVLLKTSLLSVYKFNSFLSGGIANKQSILNKTIMGKGHILFLVLFLILQDISSVSSKKDRKKEFAKVSHAQGFFYTFDYNRVINFLCYAIFCGQNWFNSSKTEYALNSFFYFKQPKNIKFWVFFSIISCFCLTL